MADAWEVTGHSVAVSTPAFDAVSLGSNPGVPANFNVMEIGNVTDCPTSPRMPKLIRSAAEIIGAIVLTFVVAMLLVMLWFTLVDQSRISLGAING